MEGFQNTVTPQHGWWLPLKKHLRVFSRIRQTFQWLHQPPNTTTTIYTNKHARKVCLAAYTRGLTLTIQIKGLVEYPSPSPSKGSRLLAVEIRVGCGMSNIQVLPWHQLLFDQGADTFWQRSCSLWQLRDIQRSLWYTMKTSREWLYYFLVQKRTTCTRT